MTGARVTPYARFDAFDGRGRSWELKRPLGVIEAVRQADVVPALRAVEEAVSGGAHAAGFVAYEAAPAFDAALTARAPRAGLPLLWFGLFAERHEGGPLVVTAPTPTILDDPWQPALEEREYAARVAQVRDWIAAGDTYQVNLTFPLRSRTAAPDLDLYAALGRAQGAGYCALLRLPGWSVLSLSPELFFRWADGALEMRPMKGTRPRGLASADDRRLAGELHDSEKERAENLMIVDLLRNDLGRVAEFGSVEVPSLFEVESYPTVHQLTSTLRARARGDVTLVDLFRALFPSGSVTGAPKVRTMQIIGQVEEWPRGVYAGAVGLVSPDLAVFNVPIRTLLLADDGAMEMSVGSGVTWDSEAAAEYAECLQKAAFTWHTPPAFSLLETMLYEPATGFAHLRRHLDRLAESAGHFAFRFDPAEGVRVVEEAVADCAEPRRVRLLLSPEGNLSVEIVPLAEVREPLQARLALTPVDSRDRLLYHKTTWRAPYEERLAERPGFDEVLLVNERGELTEFANGNLVVRIDGVAWTPPVESGLLPGVLRADLLERGELRERVLRPGDLARAEGVWRINSVRGWSAVEGL